MMQKARAYVHGWCFKFAPDGGRRPWRPIKRSAMGESFAGDGERHLCFARSFKGQFTSTSDLH
jgi:hypothetical protein